MHSNDKDTQLIFDTYKQTLTEDHHGGEGYDVKPDDQGRPDLSTSSLSNKLKTAFDAKQDQLNNSIQQQQQDANYKALDDLYKAIEAIENLS